jgi:hypothetical protein
MSTRATILIKSKRRNEEVRIYHHCDGYPDGIGIDLKAYIKTISSLKLPHWDVYHIANDLIKGQCGMVGNRRDNGYELTPCQHGDEEYAYLIDCDAKTLTCYAVGWDEFEWDEKKIVEIPD